jgi:hypothetical protein
MKERKEAKEVCLLGTMSGKLSGLDDGKSYNRREE